MSVNKMKVDIDFFTEDKRNDIRRDARTFGSEWAAYVAYHRGFEKVDSSNAIYLMKDFRIVYEEIKNNL